MQPNMAVVSRLCTQLTARAADVVQLASYTRDNCQHNVREVSCSPDALHELRPLTDG